MNFIDRAFWSHEQADRAQRFAKNRQLRDAITIANQIINTWSDSPGFLERQMRKVSINGLIADLKSEIKIWERKVKQAEQLAQKASLAFTKSNTDPWETKSLENAISLYNESLAILEEVNWKTQQTICQHKLKQKQTFQKCYQEGKQKFKEKYYKKALQKFEQAQSLFATTELTKDIINCRQQLQQEEQYEQVYNQAIALTKQGDFQSAIAQLHPAFLKFPRQDGKTLLDNLKTIIEAKKAYQQGLITEKLEHLEEAKTYYNQARNQLPSLGENCSLRLALIAIKTQQWSLALKELNFLTGEKANYLRGYIYVQQGNYKLAHREWKSLSHPQLKEELNKLKTLVKREKLAFIQDIERAVDEEKLEEAKILSQAFLNQFGCDHLVEENLKQHIIPRLENSDWKTKTWQELAQKTESAFRQNQDITSLHNWAVATYYQAQLSSEKMSDWITAWGSAIANLSQDPALKNIPWLGSERIDFNQVSEDLKNILANAIDQVKEQNLEQYFSWRDQYRRDISALEYCVTVKGLNITPSCYQRHQNHFHQVKLSPIVYGALYTDWGKAVAACLDGDIKRSFILSPTSSSETPAAKYGERYVAYHQGIYYLQNQEWRKAKSLLQDAETMIKEKPEWGKEIDRLCEEVRLHLSEKEAFELTQFWYELLGSDLSCRYYVEQQADHLRDKIAEERISWKQGKRELEKLKRIDPQNPVVLDLIKTINRVEEAEEIFNLLEKPDLEGAVRRAQSCEDETLRYKVAKICIEILLQGVRENDLYSEDIMRLARWAYSLCPYEPEFQPIYRELTLARF